VIRLEPHLRAAELDIKDDGAFLAFVSQAFQHKRKTLRNNLAPALGKSFLSNSTVSSIGASLNRGTR
jgi:16S rRNA A1518/A1519 N6-dimethyltransferase RsmA/KsgA/DIM1 with predicted DNA glycosylase/AP lyase activity